MLCCVGLIGGFAVGQYLGGPWIFIAPAAGFGIGLVGDMKFMRGHHKKADQHDTGVRAKKDADPVCGMEVDESKPEHQVEHMGKTYYFCCAACQGTFTAQPEKYVSSAALGHASGRTDHHGHG